MPFKFRIANNKVATVDIKVNDFEYDAYTFTKNKRPHHRSFPINNKLLRCFFTVTSSFLINKKTHQRTKKMQVRKWSVLLYYTQL